MKTSPEKSKRKKITFRKSLLAALLLCAQALSFSAQEIEPKFQDYKVDSIFGGPNHELNVPDQGEDSWKTYRAKAIQRKVNFAGHYILFTGGCGGETICGETLDANTDKFASGHPNPHETIFHPDSRLLVFSGISETPEIVQNG